MTEPLSPLLRQLFEDGELDSPRQAHELFELLRSDDAAARDYDCVAMAARALESPDHKSGVQRSDMEKSFHAQSFMFALDAQLEQERSDERVIKVDFSRAQLTTRILAIAALLLATLGVATLLRPVDPLVPEAFQARSATSPDVVLPGFELFCVTPVKGAKPVVTGKAEASMGVISCGMNAEVQFAYTNPEGDHAHLAVFGVSESGALMWYGPSPARPATYRIQPAEGLRPMGNATRLGVNHSPGNVKVYALFSESPLDYITLQAFVKRQTVQALYARTPMQRELPKEWTLVTRTFDVKEVQ